MKFKIFLYFLLLTQMADTALAQKVKKPQVLIYGTDMLAFAAALQSAQSDVPTVWVLDDSKYMRELSERPIRIENSLGMDGGIWLDLLMSIGLSPTKSDSLAQVIKQDIQPGLFAHAVEQALAKQPNLSLVFDDQIKSIRQNKRNWSVSLKSKRRFEVRAIVDASQEQELRQLISTKASGLSEQPVEPVLLLKDMSAEQLRTLVASGQAGDQLYGIRFANIIAGEQNGFIDLRGLEAIYDKDPLESLPLKSNIGQAIGATAAYLAFFKTGIDKLDVRKLQTELLTYGMRLMPFQDVRLDDANFNAIQKIALTAIWAPEELQEQLLLAKHEHVSFAEVKPIFDQLYTRAQLWFLDHDGDNFQWKDFLSLIQFVGLRGEEIEKQIAADWSTKLGFEGSFDAESLVSRYQFAVILDRYASPYTKAITRDGEFVH